MIAADVCPGCGSPDVRASEPRWFAMDLDRRAELDSAESDGGWVDRVEFACHGCGLHWD